MYNLFVCLRDMSGMYLGLCVSQNDLIPSSGNSSSIIKHDSIIIKHVVVIIIITTPIVYYLFCIWDG